MKGFSPSNEPLCRLGVAARRSRGPAAPVGGTSRTQAPTFAAFTGMHDRIRQRHSASYICVAAWAASLGTSGVSGDGDVSARLKRAAETLPSRGKELVAQLGEWFSRSVAPGAITYVSHPHSLALAKHPVGHWRTGATPPVPSCTCPAPTLRHNRQLFRWITSCIFVGGRVDVRLGTTVLLSSSANSIFHSNHKPESRKMCNTNVFYSSICV